ncbi:MAG: hypothetical protein R6V37_03250, partial [Psychroflexus maritimus]
MKFIINAIFIMASSFMLNAQIKTYQVVNQQNQEPIQQAFIHFLANDKYQTANAKGEFNVDFSNQKTFLVKIT